MTPVVNRLADDYGEKVEFRSINAGIGEGQRAFNSYGLRGHPSYVILNPTGDLVWVGFGPQAREFIASAIEKAIATFDGSSAVLETMVDLLPTLSVQ